MTTTRSQPKQTPSKRLWFVEAVDSNGRRVVTYYRSYVDAVRDTNAVKQHTYVS